jgi:predicted pyridoxine 5'-phosphate oxidase superfamily flavin-nucleotide-binding protein
MGYAFMDIARTPSVKAAQTENGSAAYFEGFKGDRQFERFTEAETEFIAERDGFYMATVSETGWPYVQYRGGPPGFLRVIDDRTLAFADFRGNRQYISVGNLKAAPRAALILMDYAHRRRLKIYTRVETKNLADDPALAEKLAISGYRAKSERILLLHLEAFDWNCPQHITPRFTEAEIAKAVQPLHLRLQELEAENAALRAQRVSDRASSPMQPPQPST